MQTVVITDVHRFRPRAYCHRHKMHPPFPNAKKDGWTKSGPNETRRILESILPMVKGEDIVSNKKQIFKSKPHITWDNYFSDDVIMDWCGKNGFGMLCTVQRGRLPKGIPTKYFQKLPTSNGDNSSKVGRFNQPIIATKDVDIAVGKKYRKVHVSFQSTSSCNIQGVNSLNNVKLFTTVKSRGRGVNKREWVIEMNEARQTYLGTYGTIDTIDSMIEKCHHVYISWKYWHAMKRHVDALAVVVAYDFYKECINEPLAREAFGFNESDKINVMDFHEFKVKLSKQGISYTVNNKVYDGDKFMRSATKLHKQKLRVKNKDGSSSDRKRGRPKKDEKIDKRVCSEVFKEEKKNGSMKSRLCGDLTHLVLHEQKMVKTKEERVCVFCGEPCQARCDMCPGRPYMHYNVARGPRKDYKCFLHYHNNSMLGLGRNDQLLIGKKRSEWVAPSESLIRRNRVHIRKLEEEYKANH